jgi:hypothetical protein
VGCYSGEVVERCWDDFVLVECALSGSGGCVMSLSGREVDPVFEIAKLG